MRLSQCHNFHDFHTLAKRRLPGPIFNYIDGGADDEATLRRNTASFDSVDLLPHVLRGVKDVDLSTTIMGQKLALPFYLSPTALQRLFHHDAVRAADVGCDAVVLSNHGGRQLDGSRSPFDGLAEVVDAVGDRLDVIMDSGIQRGTHVMKALSMGAKAVGLGRAYLFPLAAAGQPGVERMLGLMKDEVERDMRLMGAARVADLSRDNLRFH